MSKSYRIIIRMAVGTGYEVPDGFRFDQSENTRARKAWDTAVQVDERVTGSEVHDAVLAVEEGSEPAPAPSHGYETQAPAEHLRFALGQRVRKVKGSSWHGRIVGTYSTALTPAGYAVESEREPGSVQIYPEAALEIAETQTPAEPPVIDRAERVRRKAAREAS